MPEPERPRVGLEYFYGVIVQSAIERDTTQAMWDRIRGAADQAGVSIGPDAFSKINGLRSNAVAMINASRNLQRAPADYSLESSMIGRPIYARPEASFEALPQWEARFQLRVQTSEGVGEQWVRVVYGADRPSTVGELLDDLELFAQDMAPGYGGELVGWSNPILNQV
jgi:hypothetical protein